MRPSRPMKYYLLHNILSPQQWHKPGWKYFISFLMTKKNPTVRGRVRLSAQSDLSEQGPNVRHRRTMLSWPGCCLAAALRKCSHDARYIQFIVQLASEQWYAFQPKLLACPS